MTQGTGPRRPWNRLMFAVIVLLVLLLAIAFWSEDEDLENLPPSEIESSEEAPNPG